MKYAAQQAKLFAQEKQEEEAWSMPVAVDFIAITSFVSCAQQGSYLVDVHVALQL